MANLSLAYPTQDDAPDIDTINDNFKQIEENYNSDVAAIETVIAEKMSLLYQIVSVSSFFTSDVSALLTSYESVSTADEKIAVLKQIANEIAIFSSATAPVLLESLNSL